MQREKRSRFCGCVGLTREQIDFLDSLSRSCRYSGGKKLSKAEIVRALIGAAKELDIDVATVKGERQLRDKIVDCFCKSR